MNNALQWHLEIFGNNYFSRLDRILPRMASYDRVSRCTTNTNRSGSDRQSIKCHTNWTRMKYVYICGCRFEEKSFDKMHHIYQKCIMLVIYASHLSCNAGSGGEPGEDGDVLLFYQGDGFCHQVTTSHCHHNVAWFCFCFCICIQLY